MDKYNEVAMLETAKWVIADAAAKDLGMNDPTTSYIVSEYVNNPPSTTIYEDTFLRAAANLTGQTPTPTAVGANVYTLSAAATGHWKTDNLGKIYMSGAVVAQNIYELGTNTCVLTTELNPDEADGLYVRYADNSNFFRLAVYTTSGSDKIDVERRLTGTTTTPATSAGTGLLDGTWYRITTTLTPTTIQFQVATVAAPTTYIFDETITDSNMNTNTEFLITNFSSVQQGTQWREFKAVT
jgi:hypothetical protein